MSPLEQTAKYLDCSEQQVFKLACESRPKDNRSYMGEFRNYVRSSRVPLFVLEYCISINKQATLLEV